MSPRNLPQGVNGDVSHTQPNVRRLLEQHPIRKSAKRNREHDTGRVCATKTVVSGHSAHVETCRGLMPEGLWGTEVKRVHIGPQQLQRTIVLESTEVVHTVWVFHDGRWHDYRGDILNGITDMQLYDASNTRPLYEALEAQLASVDMVPIQSGTLESM